MAKKKDPFSFNFGFNRKPARRAQGKRRVDRKPRKGGKGGGS